MSLLIFTAQKHRIIAEKNSVNYKLMNLRNKLMDLQTYAAQVSDGSVSMRDLLEVPSSLFGRMGTFMNYSNAVATMGAAQNFQFMQRAGAFNQFYAGIQTQTQDPGQQQFLMDQTNMMVFSKLKEEQMKKVAEQEKAVLNAQDKQISMQIAQLEGRLNMLSAEEEKVNSAEQEACKKSAPGYVA